MGSGLVFCFLILDSIFSNNILQVGLMNQAPTLFFSKRWDQVLFFAF